MQVFLPKVIHRFLERAGGNETLIHSVEASRCHVGNIEYIAKGVYGEAGTTIGLGDNVTVIVFVLIWRIIVSVAAIAITKTSRPDPARVSAECPRTTASASSWRRAWATVRHEINAKLLCTNSASCRDYRHAKCVATRWTQWIRYAHLIPLCQI